MWGEKRYYSLDFFLKQKFQRKIVKIPIDGGFTCPNRDGTKGKEGCAFCSGKGSGEFAGIRTDSIFDQIEMGRKRIESKWSDCGYIAYFQAFTNTYAPVDQLKKKYEQALCFPDVVGLAIATRPDCIDDSVLDLLSDLNRKTTLWVELGLQTIHDKTAELFHRGYNLECFEDCLNRLHSRGIDVVVHVIFGLPGEEEREMTETISYLSNRPIQGIKIQLLHVLEGTVLARWYREGKFSLLEQEEYVNLVCQSIRILRPDIVIHRLTGDGAGEILIGPMWSRRKRQVLNNIQKRLKEEKIEQGDLYFYRQANDG